MRVGSLFSGIGGLDLGLHRAGHEHAFFCEADPWRREVLAARWPGVPVFGDVRTLGEPAWGVAADERGASVDFGRWESGTGLLCGGFPCQDLSVAGKRAGLAGNRSGLFFEFARIIESVRPGWILVENVPGLLSSQGGRDFGVVLGTLADLGYGVAWRIVDSRFFGVPQRRRRVFIVGAVADGDPRAAAERAGQVLAVGSGCARHLAPRGETRPNAPVASLSGLGNGGPDDNDGQQGRLVANTLGTRVRHAHGDGETMIAPTMREHPRPGSNSDGLLIAAPLTKGSAAGEGVNQPERRQEDDVNLVPTQAQTFDWQMGGSWSERGPSRSWIHDKPGRARALVKNKTLAVWEPQTIGVRRLTPTECERLQGFPDDWTQLGGTPDSRRYSALGDAVTVNVAEWIGGRLAA